MRLPARWLVLSRSSDEGRPVAEVLEQGALQAKLDLRKNGQLQFFRPVPENTERFGIWTDDHSSILRIVGQSWTPEASGLIAVPVTGDGR